MRRFPRTLIVCLAAAGLMCSIADAQEQERKLIDRIQNPDRTLSSPLQGKTFGGAAASPVKEFKGASRAFGGADKAAVKAFRETRSFLGIKNPWFGSKVHPTGDATLGKKSASLANRVFPVAAASVRSSPIASKKIPSADAVVGTAEFAGKGGAQGALDQIIDKIHREMTIDDVRELLNNPR